jgi:hypothetical protein
MIFAVDVAYHEDSAFVAEFCLKLGRALVLKKFILKR